MNYATARPYADPEKAARRILEIANAVEPIQGRIHIEKINEPFLFRDRASPAEYGAGLKLAIERGCSRCTSQGPSSPSRQRARSCLLSCVSPAQPISEDHAGRLKPLPIPGFGFFSGGNDVELRSPHCGG
jgi:hypothetical protein